jgi:hypothetical protein
MHISVFGDMTRDGDAEERTSGSPMITAKSAKDSAKEKLRTLVIHMTLEAKQPFRAVDVA